MRKLALTVAAGLLSLLSGTALAAPPIQVVAAENFYADIAQQIGGPEVEVASILNNPNQDPHDFEASPSTARQVADAALVIYSGADYDPWMKSLLDASPSDRRKVIVAANLVHRVSGDNPHIWYDPATMPAVAAALTAEFSSRDPAHKADFEARLAAFEASLEPMLKKIAEMKQKHAGEAVTATEPVFGYMIEALGYEMRNQDFQLAVMNDTEPSASDLAAFQDDLKNRKVKVLIYNNQVTDDMTEKLKELAQQSEIGIVGVTETLPAGMTYQSWMMDELTRLDKAMSGPGS
ncbi:ABC transporter substrate-binding protein [Hypericibacter adhaerens]|jgi:zinc/manganese transport system substrate-binding protein|uniref:ABC transporter substrate-binding protein n=1 Tax=Hypericibacter adhaerens TaxID=2602016 RepID=A0A5J6N692_9PROT|nr:zinc ABC transporter substrate-binding protein [Hypericibacter adhaerens]QEX24445.1 ABC transporter substrate-binding protein [Hypericibacter adhaerens]